MNTFTSKPNLTFLLLMTIFFVSCSIVYAQNDPADTTETEEQRTTTEQAQLEGMMSEERLQNGQQQPERVMPIMAQERQQQVEERSTQLQARAQERILNLAANMSNRMEAAITRIENISIRLESRISKLSAQGIDTAEAELQLAGAKLSIEAATESIAEIDELVTSMVMGEAARKGWIEVRKTFLTTRDHLRTAQAELRASVAALKLALREAATETGVSEAVRMNATSTEEAEEAN